MVMLRMAKATSTSSSVNPPCRLTGGRSGPDR
jgi:hypothetical protein